MPTSLGTDGDGRAVLRKTGDPGRVAREAALLAEASHPGVVEVASASDGELVLRWAGGRTLAGLRPGTQPAAALVATLAATVADLHAIGLRHGAIRGEHVVLDGGGRPVLCGFGGAGRAGEPGAPEEADDVAALGELLRALVGSDIEPEPIPEHRFGRRRAWAGAGRGMLLTLADQATHDDPARRPTAHRLAAALASVAPESTEAGAGAGPESRWSRQPGPRRTIEPRRQAPERQRPRVPWRLVVGAVGVGLVAAGLSSVLGARPAGRAPSAPVTGRPEGEAIEVLDCPTVAEPAADHDGDGCVSTVAVEAGVVVVEGTRYGVGRPGDAVAVGDWDCDGAATVAVVRPATGEVFVFDRWAGPGADLVVPATAVVPGAVRAEPGATPGCAGLAVVDGAGDRTEVVA